MEVKHQGTMKYIQSTITPPEGLVEKLLEHRYTFFPFAENDESYNYWTGHMPYTGQIWDVVPESAVLLDYVKESVAMYGYDLNQYFAKCWVVMVPKGQNVARHDHHGDVSGYWILKDTNTVTSMEIGEEVHEFENFDGNFMVFDSNIPHWNTVNESEDTRVTLAFTVSNELQIAKELAIQERQLERLTREGVKQNLENSLYTRQFDVNGNIVIEESYVPLV